MINSLGFSKPLRYSLKGHRRLRVSDYRIIYRIEINEKQQSHHKVVIIAIKHRKNMYLIYMRLPIYLDYMSTTPTDPRVAAKMRPYLTMNDNGVFANAASTHYYGRQAKAAIEIAREQVALLISATPDEIIWTSGATEANNLALKGAALFYQRQGKHIVTCTTEHKSVLAPLRYLATLGFDITYLKPQTDGLLNLTKLEQALRADTIMVSIMQVNNEIGVIQNIEAIGALTRARGILFHVDAAQSVGKIPVDVKKNQIDLLSCTAHKFYGPKGIGALYVRGKPRLHLVPQIHGGEQEHNLRSGTLATHQIVGMGEASRIALEEMADDNERILSLRQRFWSHLEHLILPNTQRIQLNGHATQRIASNLNINFGNLDAEILLTALDDLAISTGSACNSLSLEPSHVLLAIGIPRQLAANALRFSFGKFTTIEEVDYAAKQVKRVITALS